MAHLYLSDDVAGVTAGDVVEVSGSEARHAITVGRLKVGEHLRLGDGQGTIARGTVSSVDGEQFAVTVESVSVEVEPSPSLWLAQALAKNDRDEQAIQAATELGIDGIVPWAAGRSIVKWEGPKRLRHEQRWANILREASKQSLRHRIPTLHPLATTSAIARLGDSFHLVVLDPNGTYPLTALKPDGRDLLLVVGPEGGIAQTELAAFVAAGASVVSMGPGILRTSTAGPAAVAVLNGILQRW